MSIIQSSLDHPFGPYEQVSHRSIAGGASSNAQRVVRTADNADDHRRGRRVRSHFCGRVGNNKGSWIRTNGSVLAFIMGFLIATFFCVVLYISIVFTGAANYLTGALAERWTRQEFAAAGFRVAHVPLTFPSRPDTAICHTRLTWTTLSSDRTVYSCLRPKYSSSPVDLGAVQLEKRVNEAMKQVEDNVGRVRPCFIRLLGSSLRPVIIFWGRLVKSAATPVRRVNGTNEVVRIVHGGDAKEWRPKLTEKAILSAKDIQNISSRIEAYLSEMNRNMKTAIRVIQRNSGPLVG